MSNYHGRIMNIPAHEDYARRESRISLAMKEGHRDARHAAAEIALNADTEIERLRARVAELEREMIDTTWQDHADHWQKRAVQAEARVAENEALRARVAELEAVLSQYADKNNWGYYDDSGCDKGRGQYTDACFIGPELARAALEGKG